MPKYVYLDINPAYKPRTDEDKAKFESMRKNFRNNRPVAIVTAAENVRLSKGMLRVRPDARQSIPAPTALEELPTEQLKVMMLTAGITPSKKQMTREEVIRSIRTKMASIEVADDAD
jgi:hypothetical protein